MYILFRKEIREFLGSLTGYIVVLVFLVINSLFMWIFPGEFNVLDGGYANLDTLFVISPWVFLFLVPAVTMRLFAEERKTGTLDLLLTRPVSELKIVLSKYFAGLALVLLSLLPTLVYYVAIYQLGNPVGNLDNGGIVGSYFGLFLLASIYVSIGVFASALTQNQIVSFIIAMLLSFIFYFGFDSVSSVVPKDFQELITFMGINEHYRSISRGVMDTRDVVYFISVAIFFIFSTRMVLQSRKW